MGTKLLFACKNAENLVVGAEVCEDVWVLNPPSSAHAAAGATVIVNCSASDETTGKARLQEKSDFRTVSQTFYALTSTPTRERESPPRI